MEAAVVDLHTAPGSFVYSTDVDAWKRGIAGTHPDPTALISAGDRAAQQELQTLLDTGSHDITILPPGIIVRDDEPLLPILITGRSAPATR
jgi:hypothetical protein